MKTFKRIVDSPGLRNIGIISGTSGGGCAIYRGAQPDKNGYETLKARFGIRTVINLRNHDETAEIESANMIGKHFPLTVLMNVSVDKIAEIVDVMGDPNNQPVFVHCAQGHDRTGVICAAYRISRMGWSLDEAIEEMQAYGYNDLWVPMMHSLREFAAKIGVSKTKEVQDGHQR